METQPKQKAPGAPVCIKIMNLEDAQSLGMSAQYNSFLRQKLVDCLKKLPPCRYSLFLQQQKGNIFETCAREIKTELTRVSNGNLRWMDTNCITLFAAITYAEQVEPILGYLLALGFDSNSINRQGKSLLVHASHKKQNIRIIRQLLKAGANPLIPNKLNQTPYEIIASEQCNQETLDLLKKAEDAWYEGKEAIEKFRQNLEQEDRALSTTTITPTTTTQPK